MDEPDEADERLAYEADELAHLGAYFGNSVKPRLKACFSALSGRGRITFRYEFARRGDVFVLGQNPAALSIFDSEIDDQATNDAALRCMREAMSGVEPLPESLHVEGEDDYLIYWSWYLPAPPP